MHLANCYCQANGDSQEASKLGLPLVSLKNLIQWLTARVIHTRIVCPSRRVSASGLAAQVESIWLRASIRARAAGGPEEAAVLQQGDCQDWRWVAMLPR